MENQVLIESVHDELLLTVKPCYYVNSAAAYKLPLDSDTILLTVVYIFCKVISRFRVPATSHFRTTKACPSDKGSFSTFLCGLRLSGRALLPITNSLKEAVISHKDL